MSPDIAWARWKSKAPWSVIPRSPKPRWSAGPTTSRARPSVAFVTLSGSRSARATNLRRSFSAHVAKEIGTLAKPDEIRFTDALPKTRSGKIMRRLLRDIASSQETRGDITTLEDLSVLERLRASAVDEE